MATVMFWGLKSELGQGNCPQCGQSLREKERWKNHMQTSVMYVSIGQGFLGNLTYLCIYILKIMLNMATVWF